MFNVSVLSSKLIFSPSYLTSLLSCPFIDISNFQSKIEPLLLPSLSLLSIFQSQNFVFIHHHVLLVPSSKFFPCPWSGIAYSFLSGSRMQPLGSPSILCPVCFPPSPQPHIQPAAREHLRSINQTLSTPNPQGKIQILFKICQMHLISFKKDYISCTKGSHYGIFIYTYNIF